jgi:hypothetical protein
MIFFILFWVILILASIAWYGFLVFYVGIKAGRDVRTLMNDLERNNSPDQ